MLLRSTLGLARNGDGDRMGGNWRGADGMRGDEMAVGVVVAVMVKIRSRKE